MRDNVSVTIPGIIAKTDDQRAPGDLGLLAPWFNVMRSLRDAALTASRPSAGNYCHAVLTVHVVVDESGEPLHNTRPRFVRLEPRAKGEAFEALIAELTE